MKRLISILCICCLLGGALAEAPANLYSSISYGFGFDDGEPELTADSLLQAELDGRCGFVNLDGELVIPMEWDEVQCFSEGLARVLRGGKYGFIDETGALVIPCEWDDADVMCREGRIWVRRGDRYGYLDAAGALVAPGDYTAAARYSEGFAAVVRDGRAGFLNLDGSEAFPFAWKDVQDFHGGMAAVQDADGRWGYISAKGEVVVPCEWEQAIDFENGLGQVLRGDEGGFFNTAGTLVVSFDRQEYDMGYAPSPVPEGLWLRRFGEWGFADRDGTMLLSYSCLEHSDFSEGLAAIYRNGKWGYIDAAGELLIPCQWDSTSNFHEGLAAVSLNDEYGYIDKTGELAIPLQWELADDFSEGLARVIQDGSQGFINVHDEWVVAPKLTPSWFGRFQNGLCVQTMDGRDVCLDRQGSVLVTGEIGTIQLWGNRIFVLAPADETHYVLSVYDSTGNKLL